MDGLQLVSKSGTRALFPRAQRSQNVVWGTVATKKTQNFSSQLLRTPRIFSFLTGIFFFFRKKSDLVLAVEGVKFSLSSAGFELFPGWKNLTLCCLWEKWNSICAVLVVRICGVVWGLGVTWNSGFMQDFWTPFQLSCFSPISPKPLCRMNNFHVKSFKIWNDRGCKIQNSCPFRDGTWVCISESGWGTARSCCFVPHFWSTVQRGDLMPQPFPPELPNWDLPPRAQPGGFFVDLGKLEMLQNHMGMTQSRVMAWPLFCLRFKSWFWGRFCINWEGLGALILKSWFLRKIQLQAAAVDLREGFTDK